MGKSLVKTKSWGKNSGISSIAVSSVQTFLAVADGATINITASSSHRIVASLVLTGSLTTLTINPPTMYNGQLLTVTLSTSVVGITGLSGASFGSGGLTGAASLTSRTWIWDSANAKFYLA